MKRSFRLLPLVVVIACGGEAEIERETADNETQTTGSELAGSTDPTNQTHDRDRAQFTAATAQTDKAMGKGSKIIYGSLADWDQDGDRQLTLVEFKAGLKKHDVYGKWDTDGSGGLVDREYQNALFNAWDSNRDGIVDSFEFRDSASHWVGRDVTYGAFADWDLDGDMEIVAAEFDKGVKKYHFFESYDADGNGEISDQEYQTALFNAWDMDGDQRIDAVEYRW